jgi:hypothetical protein
LTSPWYTCWTAAQPGVEKVLPGSSVSGISDWSMRSGLELLMQLEVARWTSNPPRMISATMARAMELRHFGFIAP